MKLIAAILLTSAFAVPALGGVTVTPASPTATDTIRIRVANAFGSVAVVGSASISRTGNTFIVQQHVNLVCPLASNPTVESEFDVGPLPPGTYNVTANLTFSGAPADVCVRPPLTQTTTFIVAPPVPTLAEWTLLLLAAALAASAVVALQA